MAQDQDVIRKGNSYSQNLGPRNYGAPDPWTKVVDTLANVGRSVTKNFDQNPFPASWSSAPPAYVGKDERADQQQLGVDRPAVAQGVQERTPITQPSSAITPTSVAPAGAGAGRGLINPPAVTPDTAQGVTRNGNSFSGSNLKEDPSKPLTTIDMNANNESMARANAIRESMLSRGGGGGGGESIAGIPDAHAMETQQLFAKWANEALVRDMMGQRGGATAAASLVNGMRNNNTQLANTQMQGQNQLAVTGMQGQNQLANTQLQGQNQLGVTQMQGDNQLASVGLQGRNQLANTDLSNQGGLARTAMDVAGRNNIADKETAARTAAAQATGLEKHFDSIPKVLETMTPSDPDYKELMGIYKSQLLSAHRGSQGTSGMPTPKTPADVAVIPKGTRYTAPDGTVRMKS